MPTFKRFDGFRIDVRSREHNPPHFHVIGPGYEALIWLSDLQVRSGSIPRKIYAEAITWAAAHTTELLTEWSRLNDRD